MDGFNVFACESNLAPYAVRSSQGMRRRIAEGGHAFRTPFQRDRDRIVHSRAFRRLDGKTQVFLNGSGDHYRTRLTHTIEVAALARTMARRLRLNEDLTEAIALAHDLGHTPFGHMGERVLDELLDGEEGGFDHNRQCLRIVDYLEEKYPGRDGLNLTWEVRAGLIKHRDECRGAVLDGECLPPNPCLEAQVADVADDLAYYAHDVDDGLEAGLLDEKMLEGLAVWRRAMEIAGKDGPISGVRRINYTVRCMIDMFAADVINHSVSVVADADPEDCIAVRQLSGPLVGFSPAMKQASQELRVFLFKNLYRHSDIMEINERMGNVMRRLFQFLHDNPEHLGAGSRSRLDRFGLNRVVADYIAGMTDSYAVHLFEKFALEKSR
jgi:dGTPase